MHAAPVEEGEPNDNVHNWCTTGAGAALALRAALRAALRGGLLAARGARGVALRALLVAALLLRLELLLLLLRRQQRRVAEAPVAGEGGVAATAAVVLAASADGAQVVAVQGHTSLAEPLL